MEKTINKPELIVAQPLTPKQQTYLLRVRFKHWNEPVSLWKPIVFSKEPKKKIVKASTTPIQTTPKKK